MINFRFHVVSLIAIFLALALGVVIGAGVIDRGVVNTLNDRLDSVESKSDRIKSENDALVAENEKLSGSIQAMEPFAVDGRMAGETTALLAVRGVDEAKVKATASAQQTAGATVSGILWIEDKWNLSDAGTVKNLQDALGVTIKNKAALRTEAWRQIGVRLATPPSDVGTDDLLATLATDGFLTYQGVDGGSSSLATFPGLDASVTMITGTTAKVSSDLLVIPVADGVHGASIPLVVADQWVDVSNGPSRGAALQPLRESDLGRSVSTVDDLDQPMGSTTVVLALADLLRIPPVVGSYGYGPGTQPMPSPVAG